MYVKDIYHGYVTVCLYVYSMLIVGSDDKTIISTKKMLNSRFERKDMGLDDVILGTKLYEHHMDSFQVNHIMLIIFLEV